ncbi:Sensory box histidine kinase/response regulator [hydrothermal vent metagenome]|uniref:Sensory box histidine kinase/response regulator n=1 Tax=hydrothermal vent metagenome TaxID=652676 RepID=A0A1W1E6Z8_9ZZZZ
MKKIERYFDINMVLMTIYSALESIREEKGIELVYDIDSTIPKELKGDSESVTHLLTQLLVFIFQNTENKEVTLALHAPDDFLYEEAITFEIENIDISKEKVESFLDVRLNPILKRLEGIISFDAQKRKIALLIPFKLKDLGNRRYYRLPDIGMLGKKVLLICKSKIVADSLCKMFKYFLYEVDVGAEAYKKRGSNLAHYDIFVLDESLLTDGIEALVIKVQQTQDLKFVLLKDAKNSYTEQKKHISAYLIKPVMQESIFELIIALFEADIKERKIKKEAGKPIINMEKYILDAFKRSEEAYVEMSRIRSKITPKSKIAPMLKEIEREDENDHSIILNLEEGKMRAKKKGVEYVDALQHFTEKFEGSDRYFRDIAKSKAVWQIKEFAIDLEKEAREIGAERVARLAEKIGLLFVYNNLEMLPVYPGKYHLELNKLLLQIKNYLKKQKSK